MHNFKSFLDEGKNDKSIFHVIFMAGGPGSGKSYIIDTLGLKPLNYKIINSDSAFELAMKKSLLDLNMPAGQDYVRDIVRGLAKKTTMKQKGHAIDGRLGMVIDGTGAKANAIKKMADDFTKLGYETAIVFIDTDEQTALDRNNARERSLRPSLVTKMWKDVQSNKSVFQSLFGKRFWVIDNSITESNPSAITKVYSRIAAWSSKLPNNPQVKAWMDAQ